MINLKFEGIEKNFDAIPGQIFTLVLENPSIYYKYVRALYLEDEETIIISKDGEIINQFSKYVFFLNNLFDLNPNSKKYLTSIYKQAPATYLNDSRKIKISKIQDEINDLLDDVSLDFGYPMTFDRSFGLDKIMQTTAFSFSPNDQTSFFQSFIAYLKATLEISRVKFIVVLDLFSVLSQDDVPLLEKELSLIGVCVVNICPFNRKIGNYEEKTVVIDSDYCEF